MKKLFILCTYLLSSSLLFGCSSLSESRFWLEDTDTKVEDKRITILPTPTILKPNPEVLDVDIILPTPRVNTSWPLKTGAYNPKLPLAVREYKKIDIGSEADDSLHLPTPPVIHHHSLFVMDGEKTVSAYNITNYQKLWSVELADPDETLPGGGIAYFKNRLYVTLGHNIIYAVDATNGKLLWKRKVNGIIRSAPAVNFSAVVVTSIDNQTYALNPKTGNIKWIHTGIRESTSTLGSPTPAIHDNVVVIPHSSGEIYALTIYDGKELWSDNVVLHSVSSHTLSDIDTMPIIDGNSIYINSHSGMLAAFELYTGRRIWERELKTSHSSWVSGNALYAISDKSELVCIIKETGLIKWITPLQRYIDPRKKKGRVFWTRPVLASDHIWAVSSEGSLVRVHATTGKIVDSIDVNDDIFVSPAIANNTLYLLEDNANLHILKNK